MIFKEPAKKAIKMICCTDLDKIVETSASHLSLSLLLANCFLTSFLSEIDLLMMMFESNLKKHSYTEDFVVIFV
jgi:hypothetical protein